MHKSTISGNIVGRINEVTYVGPG